MADQRPAGVFPARDEPNDIRAHDDAKAQPSEPVPFEQAMREIHEGKVD